MCYLVSVNKTLYKVSDSVMHMALPPGKANPYLENKSIPVKMIAAPFWSCGGVGVHSVWLVLKDNAMQGPGWTGW